MVAAKDFLHRKKYHIKIFLFYEMSIIVDFATYVLMVIIIFCTLLFLSILQPPPIKSNFQLRLKSLCSKENSRKQNDDYVSVVCSTKYHVLYLLRF